MSLEDKAREIAAHLNTYRDNVRDAVPVIVTMGNQEWAGARYQRAEHGDTMVYLVGKLPRHYKLGTGKWARQAGVHYSKPANIAYRMDGDDRDWYLAGYGQSVDVPDPRYRPFGSYWQMAPWTADTPIDYGENPYTRKPFAMRDV